MTLNPDDPKWTAYVAGELDADERSAVEQELAESAEARSLVAEIEQVIGTLVTQLKAEPLPAAPAAKVTLAAPAASPTGRRSIPWGWLVLGGTGACVAAGLILPAMNAARAPSRVAMVDKLDREELEAAPNHSSQTPAATETVSHFDRRERSSDAQFGNRRLGDVLTTDGTSIAAEEDRDGEGRKKNEGKNQPLHKAIERGRSSEYDDAVSPGDKFKSDISYAASKPKTSELMPKPTSPVATRPSTPSVPVDLPVSGSGPTPESKPTSQQVTDHAISAPVVTTAPHRNIEGIKREKSESAASDPKVPNTSKPAPDSSKPASSDLYLRGSTEQPANPYPVSGISRQSGEPLAPGPNGTVASSAKPSAENGPAPSANAPLPPGIQVAGGKDVSYRVEISKPREGDIADLRPDVSGEAYEQVTDNAFMAARENPLSTFSIDVDTASYSNIRRFLTQNRMLPPPAAVRIEEMVNYFRYNYPQPEGETPFQANIEVASCPWKQEHRLVRVGIKGREIASNKRPPSNLVFLVDVSGSMAPANKLPLVKEGLKMLTRQLTENDRIAIVVYAGSSGLVLPSTTGDKQQTILDALDRLEAGGSTNGAQGIQLAYEIALQNFLKGCTNRVILATDGDFNVGVTDRGQLISLIEQQAKTGVFLTTLGFGMGNIKDATLEQLADKGNGAYAYVDDLREAKKVLVDEMSGTLVTIAKDVKIQIEFNPAEVGAYRLIGYENRIMKHEDFNNDAKDAGEIGAGHTVTALYEIVPVGQQVLDRPTVDPLKYQPKPAAPVAEPVAGEHRGELLTLKLRYKQPDGDTSKLLEYPVKDSGQRWAQATGDFKFAASVALFGMILRNSPHKGTATLDAVAELANEGRGSDESGYRQEFISLVNTAKSLGK